MHIICVNKIYGDKTYQKPYLNILTAAVARKESSRAIHDAAPVCTAYDVKIVHYSSDSTISTSSFVTNVNKIPTR